MFVRSLILILLSFSLMSVGSYHYLEYFKNQDSYWLSKTKRPIFSTKRAPAQVFINKEYRFFDDSNFSDILLSWQAPEEIKIHLIPNSEKKSEKLNKDLHTLRSEIHSLLSPQEATGFIYDEVIQKIFTFLKATFKAHPEDKLEITIFKKLHQNEIYQPKFPVLTKGQTKKDYQRQASIIIAKIDDNNYSMSVQRFIPIHKKEQLQASLNSNDMLLDIFPLKNKNSWGMTSVVLYHFNEEAIDLKKIKIMPLKDSPLFFKGAVKSGASKIKYKGEIQSFSLTLKDNYHYLLDSNLYIQLDSKQDFSTRGKLKTEIKEQVNNILQDSYLNKLKNIHKVLGEIP